MRVLAIDPGLRCTGWVVASRRDDVRRLSWEQCGTIKTERFSSVPEHVDDVRCFGELFTELALVVRSLRLDRVPFELALEVPGAGSQSQRAATCVKGALAVVAGLAAGAGISPVCLSVFDIREEVCGKRSASKEEAAAVVEDWRHEWFSGRTKPEREAIADAMAVAHTWRAKRA